jgi:hypothetical protein
MICDKYIGKIPVLNVLWDKIYEESDNIQSIENPVDGRYWVSSACQGVSVVHRQE